MREFFHFLDFFCIFYAQVKSWSNLLEGTVDPTQAYCTRPIQPRSARCLLLQPDWLEECFKKTKRARTMNRWAGPCCTAFVSALQASFVSAFRFRQASFVSAVQAVGRLSSACTRGRPRHLHACAPRLVHSPRRLSEPLNTTRDTDAAVFQLPRIRIDTSRLNAYRCGSV